MYFPYPTPQQKPTPGNNYFDGAIRVVRDWWRSAWGYFTGPNGYLVLFAIVGIYVSLYGIFDGRHERLSGEASTERARIASSDTSGLSAAMKNLGPAQNMLVPPEPKFFCPSWLFRGSTTPNKERLWVWARDVLDCPAGCKADPETMLRVDLRRANLREADLHDVNLSKADLRGADLQHANLRGANLQGANLVGADLQHADLSAANLHAANLSGATLEKAILPEAKLTRAILRRTNLRKTTLTKADVRWANLRKAKLSGANIEGADFRLADCRGASVHALQGADAAATRSDKTCAIRSASLNDARLEIRYRIGVSYQHLGYPFVRALRAAAHRQASKMRVELVERDAKRNVLRERDNVKELIRADIDCLAFQAARLDESARAIELANLEGIPVVQFNAKANGGSSVTFVGSEQAQSGILLARWLIQLHREFGPISGIYLRGKEGEVTDAERAYALGFRIRTEGLAEEITFRTVIHADNEWATARTTTARLLSVFTPHFIIANNDDMILGALSAVEERGVGGRIKMAGVDGLPEALDAITHGRIAATVFQNSERQGAGAIRACVTYLKLKDLEGGTKLKKERRIPFKLITADNVNQVRVLTDQADAGKREYR